MCLGELQLLDWYIFARMPRAAALDFTGQMALARFAFWMAIAAGVVLFGGFFRRDREIRLLTIIYGVAMLFLRLIIAAGHLPVA
jgi:hypothetical protein